MNLPHYLYYTNNFWIYEFHSEGPKGTIKKVVTFNRLQENPVVYNLALVDVNPENGLVSDLAVSDNGDRNVILATVANIIMDFSDRYGEDFIYAKGSTPVRTRLYQIAIAGLLEDISADFDVYGISEGVVHPFQRNINYDAFLVKRK